MNKYFFLILGILLTISIASSLPTPILQTNSQWQVTSATGQEAQLTFWANGTDKKVFLGWIPPNNSCSGWTDKSLFGRDDQPIKDDKNKSITLKCETSKCLVNSTLKNCYHISLTDAQAVNINDYIKLGNNSIVSEWLNNTLYIYPTDKLDIDPFTIEVYCNDIKITTPNINWTSSQPIDKNIKFSATIPNFVCNGKLSFRQNKLDNNQCIDSFFQKNCRNNFIDYSDFESSPENIITSKETKAIYSNETNSWFINLWDNFMSLFGIENAHLIGYSLDYYGNFTDLDPSLIESYSTSTIGYYNLSEATTLGIRNLAPVLFMDFNEENVSTYVKDNSINNNYGTISGNPIWLSNGGYDGSGVYNFTANDTGTVGYISTGKSIATLFPNNIFTISAWVNPTTAGANCVANPTTGGKQVIEDTGGYISLAVCGDGAWATIYDAALKKVSTPISTGTWTHLVMTYDGISNLSLYKNGILVGSVSSGAPQVKTGTMRIGYGADGANSNLRPFNGTIDQVQFFNTALSASQVLNLYNGTKNNSNYIGKYASQGNYIPFVFYNSTGQYWNTTLSIADTYSTRTGIVNNKNEINLSNPNLVSYWKLDGDANDVKGINNGTISGGVNNATGISSRAMLFDGSTGYINGTIGIVNSSSLWINYSTGWEHIAFNGSTFFINGVAGTLNTQYPLNISGTQFIIGVNKTGSGFYKGTIDEVLLYNKSLSASEISQLYKSGLSQHATTNITLQYRTATSYNVSDSGLIGLWGLNNDSSIGESATKFVDSHYGISNGTCVSASCPSFYENGTVGGAYNFPGSKLVNMTNNSAFNFYTSKIGTISVWVRLDSLAKFQIVIIKGLHNAHDNMWSLHFESDNKPYFDMDYTACGDPTACAVVAGDAVTSGTWVHLVGVMNGTDILLYQNGIYKGKDNIGWSPTASIYPVTLGMAYNYFTAHSLYGTIDEVRIYNRTLSQSEVQDLYNLGNYHLNWNDWSSESIVIDGIPITTPSSGKFMQFKANLYTNDTSVSPYLINHTITPTPSPAVPDTNPPVCTVISRTPTDIMDNSTGILNVIMNCTDPSGINMTKVGGDTNHNPLFITRTVDAFILAAGIPNYWSNRYPNNSLGVIGALTPPFKIWRALGRNEGYWYDSLTGIGISSCQGLTPCYAPMNDTFSYAIEDGEYGHFVITSENTVNTSVIINYTHPAVDVAAFRQSIYLSYDSIVKEAKKNYTIRTNQYILTKRFDAEAYRGTQNYTMNSFRDFVMLDSPTKTLRAFYCNSSYSPTGAIQVINSPNCNLISSLTNVEINNRVFTDRNSSYSKGTYGIINGKFGGIQATSEFYIEYESPESAANKGYNLQYVNGSTNTDVKFNDTQVIWISNNQGTTWVQANWTADVFTTTTRNTNDQFQFGYGMGDTLGNFGINATMILDDITATNHPISYPLVLEYNGTAFQNDINLNETQYEIMNIKVGVAIDPDSVGNVTHNLTLRNLDGTWNYTINGSFKSPNDQDIWINFNTSLVQDGQYRMNIFAQSGDNSADVKNRTTDRNFTINNTDVYYPIFSNQVVTPATAEYSENNIYLFNISINNTNRTAGLEINGINYSLSNTDNSFYKQITDTLTAGTYNYYYWSYGNGFKKNFNRTIDYTYIINKNSSFILSLIPAPSWNVANGTLTSVFGNTCPSQLTCTLYRDGNPVSNPDIQDLPIGLYVYVYNTTGNANYTSFSINNTLNVSVGVPVTPVVSGIRICHYCQLGYYNTHLYGIKEINCVCSTKVGYQK